MPKNLKFLLLIAVLIPALSWAKPPKARIIDGVRVPVTDYPFVAQLLINGQIICSGTLVSPKYVLTAAHCFFNERNVRAVGDTDMSAMLGNQLYQSAKVYINPNYKSRNIACVEGETDAALIELSTVVNGITPINILDNPPPNGSVVTLMGFGLEGSGNVGQVERFPPDGFINIGNTILEGLGEEPPEQDPNSSYFYWLFETGEANTASGDSGGPAFYQVGNELQLAGITCGGEDNAQFGTLSFDTRADKIKSWVQCVSGISEASTAPCFLNTSGLRATIGKPFSYTIPAGGTPPVTISLTGLPSGLTFDGSTISGTPTKGGKFNLQLSAANAFGGTSAVINLKVGGFDTSMTIQKVLLQFDYQNGSKDFLDVTGKINVGKNFSPAGKQVTVQIGRFKKKFRLLSNGLSASGNSNYFDLEGPMSGSKFRKSTVRYFLTLERLEIFDALATLGFPSTAAASEGESLALPITVIIDGEESASTTILQFGSSDARWRVQK